MAAPINWFPGHQAKGLKVMQRIIRKVDVLIEVRDARLPLSSVNPEFERIARSKRRLIVYNKADLANPNMQSRIMKAFEQFKLRPPLFANAIDAKNVRDILHLANGIGREKEGPLVYKPETVMMVVGMPNVGKSSLINALRRLGTGRAKAAKVGARPGVTTSVMGKIKILDDPITYLIDTPGVMLPHIEDREVGLKLGLIAAIKDHLIGELTLARALLTTLNSLNSTAYVVPCNLTGPVDDVDVLLTALARRIGAVSRGGELDLDAAARYFLQMFRSGQLGRHTLDTINDETLARSLRPPA